MSTPIFTPSSKMHLIPASSTVPTAIKPTLFDTRMEYGGSELKITNISTVVAYVAWGITAARAEAAAVVPADGSPTDVVAVFPNSEVVFNLPINQFFTAVTSTVGPHSVLIQRGKGF